MTDNKTKREVTFEDYQKAMEDRHEKHKSFKSVNRQIFLFFLFLIVGVGLYFLTDESITPRIGEEIRLIASKALLPYVILVGAYYFVFILRQFFKSKRCPECKKLFPKGELTKFGSFQTTGINYDSSGDSYYGPTSNSVWWTECKYCGHLLWIVR